jgi:hypothetical protein
LPLYRIGTRTVLFIHIPKTAGMAVNAHLGVLWPAAFDTPIPLDGQVFAPRHQPARVLQRIYFPEMIDYAFMVVRHPVARLISEYRYQRRHPGMHLSRLRAFGFDIWLRHALWRAERNPDWRGGHFRPQVDFACFDCEVFRLENGLEQVMQGLGRATGVEIPFATAPKNVSAPRPVSLSQASLDLIARRYAADFERFGYAVEVPPIKGVTGP